MFGASLSIRQPLYVRESDGARGTIDGVYVGRHVFRTV